MPRYLMLSYMSCMYVVLLIDGIYVKRLQNYNQRHPMHHFQATEQFFYNYTE